MKCPNCGLEMKNRSFFYQSIADWDGTFSECEKYRCTNCKITYIDGDWELLKRIPPATEKQIRIVLFINSVVGTQYEPILKYPTMNFISLHIEQAKQIYAKIKEHGYDRGYDDYDLLAHGLIDEPF